MSQKSTATRKPRAASSVSAPSNSAKPTKNRPTGEDVSRYKNVHQWSYKRWAWEFLRRNVEFQKACKKVNASGSDEDKAEVAADYGLKKYKSFTEAYSSGQRPLFDVGSITSWSHVEADIGPTKKVRVKLDSGQILIRFDVASAVEDTNVLKQQLRLATIRLEKRLKQYGEATQQAVKGVITKPAPFPTYLRLLDGIATGKTQVDAGLVVNKRKKAEVDRGDNGRDDVKTGFHRQITKAREYTTELYRSLAVLPGKPASVKPLAQEEP